MSILALGRKQKREKFSIKRVGENKKRKFPIKDWEKAKEGKNLSYVKMDIRKFNKYFKDKDKNEINIKFRNKYFKNIIWNNV